MCMCVVLVLLGGCYCQVGPFAPMLHFPLQKMPDPMLFDILQLEKNDTIDELLKRHLSIALFQRKAKTYHLKSFMNDPGFCE